jgi:hypothetical protein
MTISMSLVTTAIASVWCLPLKVNSVSHTSQQGSQSCQAYSVEPACSFELRCLNLKPFFLMMATGPTPQCHVYEIKQECVHLSDLRPQF